MRLEPIIGSRLSGSVGGLTASHNTYGPYFRQRAKPVNRKTPGQVAQRKALQETSQSWRAVDSGSQQGWTDARITKKSRKGFVVTLTGQAAWMNCNLLRQRCGVPLIGDPPLTTDPVIVSVPNVAITSDDEVTITFGADDWNTDGGCVIVSCTRAMGPGVQYDQTFHPVGAIAAPGTTPTVLPLPFDVGTGAHLRFRIHVSAPDGRQNAPLDVEVFVTATLPTDVESAVVDTGGHIVTFTFTAPVACDGTAESELHVSGTGPTATAQGSAYEAVCTYAATVTTGDTWAIAGALTHVSAIPPAGPIPLSDSGLVS